jgi:hypothetical protein
MDLTLSPLLKTPRKTLYACVSFLKYHNNGVVIWEVETACSTLGLGVALTLPMLLPKTGRVGLHVDGA